ncbi:serine hydrolase [Sphingomonas sp.]|uniref:serine hydrolase n=1 Tax=Sphingomonas sp. TaxID=28214 RepID=UPI0031E32EE2
MRLLAALLLTLAPMPALARQAPAPAQNVAVSPGLQARIDALPGIVNGTGDFEDFFAPAFKAQVPKAQFDQIGQQLKAQFGVATKAEKVTVKSPYAATVQLGFEKGIGTVEIVIDPAAPHRVTGLLLSSIEPRGDTIAKIEAEIRALPGTAAFGIYALGDGVTPVNEVAGTQPMPIGSAFKLWILAEAARQVNAGPRKWSDVATLGPRSLPSGVTQTWPAGSPATLHTLATLMISISDNTATDTLLGALGRDKVDAMVARTGVADPNATLPVLTTLEAFQLKAPANADLAAKWKAAGPDGRRKLLADNRARLTATRLDPSMFGDKPLAPDIEWFASPRDEAAVMNWLRTSGGAQALAILAVNPGTPSAALFDYAGYKGGSEPGVIFMSWLVRTKKGNWYAVTGGWTRKDAAVNERGFALLMNRVLTQVAAR